MASTAAVRLGDAQVGEQERHGLGGHRGAAIGVNGQLVRADALLDAGLADQRLARAAYSRLATIHPVTYQEKMSKITYR